LYVAEAAAELRQGDVFRLNYQVVQYQKFGSGIIEQVGVKPETCLVAILSQCCDLDPKKRQRIAIAPLRKVPKTLNVAQAISDQLKAISEDQPSHINYYVYQRRSEWEDEDRAVDFTTLLYIPIGVIAGVTKLCELTIPARQGLRDRLSSHFGRVPEEEEQALINANWPGNPVPPPPVPEILKTDAQVAESTTSQAVAPEITSEGSPELSSENDGN